jgi:hypothetical protein
MICDYCGHNRFTRWNGYYICRRCGNADNSGDNGRIATINFALSMIITYVVGVRTSSSIE